MKDDRKIPERLRLIVGDLPAAGTLPVSYPFETKSPDSEGYVEHHGVRAWFGVFGSDGPWLCFAPINQIATLSAWKAVVPFSCLRRSTCGARRSRSALAMMHSSVPTIARPGGLPCGLGGEKLTLTMIRPSRILGWGRFD